MKTKTNGAKFLFIPTKSGVYLVVAIAVLIVAHILTKLPITGPLLRISDKRIYDTLIDFDNAFFAQDHQEVYEDICIVDIDEASISALGQYSSWPNLFFADLVNQLSQDGALAIGFDIFFSESDSLKGYTRKRIAEHLVNFASNTEAILNSLSTDAEYADAIRKAKNVYLGMFGSLDSTATVSIPHKLYAWKVKPKYYLNVKNLHPPVANLAEAAYGIGFAHIEPDESGVIHDFPLFLRSGGRYYVNFSFQMCLDLLGIDRIETKDACRLYQGNTMVRQLPLSPDGKFYFSYYGHQKAFRYVSFSDVLFKRLPPGFFKDRIVLVGSSASGLRDIKTTPLDQNYPGVELHATLIRNVIESTFIKWLNPQLIFVLNIFLLLSLIMLVKKTKPLISIVVYLCSTFIILAAFFVLYSKFQITLYYTDILLPWIMGFTVLLITHSHEQSIEKKKVRNAFEHYVSKEVINQIMRGSQNLAPGGVKKTISIMFIDIRNFTSLCEKLSPDEITSFVNRYFNLGTKIIVSNRGLLDKYIGDAILGLFGAPVEYPGFAYNAVKSALQIRDVSLKLRAEYSQHPVLAEFNIGIGIATGEVIVGNIGSDQIFNYTGIGDRMNFSSRLESLNKFYNTKIIIDEATFLEVKDSFLCRKLDRVQVKGKKIVTDIFEVIDFAESVTDNNSPKLRCYHLYETALALMAAHHKTEAINTLNEALLLNPDDTPCKIMQQRIQLINWDTWDGVWQHEGK